MYIVQERILFNLNHWIAGGGSRGVQGRILFTLNHWMVGGGSRGEQGRRIKG